MRGKINTILSGSSARLGRMPLGKIMVISVGILCMYWILGACSIEGKIDSAKRSSSQTTQPAQVHDDQLELLEYELVTIDGYKTINGVVINGTKHHLTLVDITFDLYNDHDFKLGEALLSNSDLESGGRWEFESSVRQHATKISPVQLKGYR